MKNSEQQLEGLTRLPTNFFPSPSSDTVENTKAHKPRVVVIAYDHSNYGDAMIAKAIRLGLITPSDDIRILNIVSQTDYTNIFAPLLSAHNTTAGIHGRALTSYAADAADVLIWEVINVLRKNGFDHATSEVMRGDPKESIIDYCRMVYPVYLITGTRGSGSVKRAVLGSVSNYLVRNCPCPVTVCKLTEEEVEARREMNAKKQATFKEVLTKFSEKQKD